MCLYNTLTSCQDDFPVLLIVTALKYAEIFRLCSTIPNYYPSWILCIKDSNWFSLMLLIRVEYFCQNNLKSMNIWFEKRPSKSSQLFFVSDYFWGLFVQSSERGQVSSEAVWHPYIWRHVLPAFEYNQEKSALIGSTHQPHLQRC